MIHNVANRIAFVLVRYGESTEEDLDIYAYAIEAVLALLFNLALCLVIAFIFGRVLEGVMFISAFALLRRFTGGYHASSHYKCIATFGILLTCAMLIMSFVSTFSISLFVAFAVATLAWLGILTLAPIDDENRTYEGEDRLRLKKKSIAVSTLLLIASVVSGFTLSIYIALILSLSMFSVFGCMVLAVLRKRIA